MKYLFIDIETGGLGLHTSLLTASFILTDVNFNILDEKSLACKPKDGVYVVEPRALELNKIKLEDHDKIAKSYDACSTELWKWLREISGDGANKPTPAGKGVYFDLGHIWDKLTSRTSWEMCVSYRHLDVGSVIEFFKSVGYYPWERSTSLEEACKFYGIDTSLLHDARADNIMAMKLLEKMQLEMIKSR